MVFLLSLIYFFSYSPSKPCSSHQCFRGIPLIYHYAPVFVAGRGFVTTLPRSKFYWEVMMNRWKFLFKYYQTDWMFLHRLSNASDPLDVVRVDEPCNTKCWLLPLQKKLCNEVWCGHVFSHMTRAWCYL